MPPDIHVSLPLPEPLALLDATLLFLIQVLISQHPDLLELPRAGDAPPPVAGPPQRAARHLLHLVRELHEALGTYQSLLPNKPVGSSGADDDLPF
jgi:hypothetical protein